MVTTEMIAHRVTPRRIGFRPVLRTDSIDIPEPIRKRVTDRDLCENTEIDSDSSSGMFT